MSDEKPRRPYVSNVRSRKRTEYIRIRLTAEERERAEREAEREGMNLSTFMRRLLSLRTGSGFIGRRRSKTRKDEDGPPSSSSKAS